MRQFKKHTTVNKEVPARICHTKNYFGESLRELRVSKNLTQIEAAKLLHVTQAQWSAYEVGKSKPTLDTIIKIAKVLQVHPYDLLDSTLNKSKYYKSMST